MGVILQRSQRIITSVFVIHTSAIAEQGLPTVLHMSILNSVQRVNKFAFDTEELFGVKTTIPFYV